MKRILFVERKASHFVSIENVFRQIARHLPAFGIEPEFQKAVYSNDLVSVIRNLLFFAPNEASVYHVTGHVHYLIFRLPRDRTILTIHDLAFLHTRTGLRRYILKKLLLDWPVRRVKYLTVVSEFTKREILEHCKIDPEKIRVIENPAGEHLSRGKTAEFNGELPLILQVGTMENKNIPRLVTAITGLRCRLRIIGPLDEASREAIEHSGVSVESVEGLDDEAMLAEYLNADIVAFCSTYEGFGLPIVEAQTVGTPVVTSGLSPMREVAGGAAILVDPFDTASIRHGLQLLIDDPEIRAANIEKGFENARRFNAVDVAQRYAELYHEVLETAGD